MILIRLIGGLGNQMFQYASGCALAARLGVEPVLDLRDFGHYRLHGYGLDRLNISARVATAAELRRWPIWRREFRRVAARVGLPGPWIFERPFGTAARWDRARSPAALDGYFQSERFFINLRTRLQAEFSPRAAPDARNARIAAGMGDGPSVSLHVRRGDYVSNARTLKVHGVCSLDYYRAAMETLAGRNSDLFYYVFSDDPSWCRENLPIPSESVFIEHNRDAPEMDIYLMSHCRHHIIANSSFSWWGAWLGTQDAGQTIAPTPWFNDPAMADDAVVPRDWLRLPK